MEKKYSYSVGKIRKVNEKNVVANVLKFRYNDTFGTKHLRHYVSGTRRPFG